MQIKTLATSAINNSGYRFMVVTVATRELTELSNEYGYLPWMMW